MVASDDYYQLLGVGRSASRETLKRAFRARIRELHPDLNHSDSHAHDATRNIIEAYQTLNDQRTRRDYDLRFSTRPEPLMSYDSSCPSLRFLSLLSAAKRLIVCLLLVLGLVAVVGAIIRDRPRVFRPVLIGSQAQLPPKHIPILVNPEPSNLLEWYQAREYQTTLANAWAASQMVKTYARAARTASRHGQHSAAKFYEDSVREVSVR